MAVDAEEMPAVKTEVAEVEAEQLAEEPIETAELKLKNHHLVD
jgi:hypothetical protein